jgi:hypothetical protein
MKKCSQSLAIKKMQIKTTLRFHLTTLRIASSKNNTKTGIGEDVGKKETSYPAFRNARWCHHSGKKYGDF